MTCAQEVSTVMGMSDRRVKKCHRASTRLYWFWKDKQDVHTVTNMKRPPTGGNEHGKAIKKLSLLQTATGTWGVLTKGTKWLIAIQLVRDHGSGQKHYFSTSWT
jgi:hypothetical protein